MLATGVEAAADLDVQTLDGGIEPPSFALKRWRSSPASPREDAMPSLQVSVPGQAVTSEMAPAPISASPISASARCSAGTSRSATKRRTMFCSTVVRTSPPEQRREIGQAAHLPRGGVAERKVTVTTA